MTKLEAARKATQAASTLSNASILLVRAATKLELAAGAVPFSSARYESALRTFKLAHRQVSDIVTSVNDADMNLHTAKG